MKKDTGVVIKKVSLCSLDNFALAQLKSKEDKLEDVAPQDKFYFVHILFLLIGLMHYIPFSFFLTANAYWMYKFRNVTADITDTDARTVLQTHFSPSNTIINSVLSPGGMILSAFFGYKMRARLRVLASLAVMCICFIAGTIFVKIDTDTWQLTFFIITMIILAIIACVNSAFSAAVMTIMARFPHSFMKSYLLGQGFGSLSSSILQIISLALATSTEVSALFYFISGSSLMMITLILFYLTKYNKLYTHHVNSREEDIDRAVISLSEIKFLAKKIWSPILTFAFILLNLAPVAPSITTLVVSEHYGSGSLWTDKYFVPVTTFLYSDIMGVIGRMVCSKVNRVIDGIPMTIFLILRLLVFVPLLFFCNAQPRHHLSVLFPHDWQYTLIVGTFNFSTGYLINMAYLDVSKLVEPAKAEDAYLVLLTFASVTSVLLSPIGMFSVDLL